MSWECPCGNSIADTSVKCAVCGRTKEQVSNYYEKEVDLPTGDSLPSSYRRVSIQEVQDINIRVVDVKIPFLSMLRIVAFLWMAVVLSVVGSLALFFGWPSPFNP